MDETFGFRCLFHECAAWGRVAAGCGNGNCYVLDMGTGEITQRNDGHTSWVSSLISFGDLTFASGSNDATIRMWTLESSEAKHLLKWGAVFVVFLFPFAGEWWPQGAVMDRCTFFILVNLRGGTRCGRSMCTESRCVL